MLFFRAKKKDKTFLLKDIWQKFIHLKVTFKSVHLITEMYVADKTDIGTTNNNGDESRMTTQDLYPLREKVH